MAIVAANTDAPAGTCPAGRGADTIVLAAGSTHALATAYESGTGLPSITSDITIAGNGATVSRATGAPDFRLFRIAADGVLTLRDLRIRAGSATDRGGAILVAGGRLTIHNAAVEDSIAPNGGAIAAVDGTLALSLATIRNNTAVYGGGIYAERGSLELTDVVMSTNRATHPAATTFGGAIYTSSALTVTRGVITANSATDGGGMVSLGAATITDATISGNAAATGFGGIDNRGVMTIVRGSVSANTAGNVGGGIGNQFSGSGSLRVTAAQITGNKVSAGDGGGLASWGELTLDGALVSGNAGGGLANVGTTSIVSSTFSGNAISNSGGLTVVAATIVGGGISGAGGSTVTGSIVSGCAGAVLDGGGNVGCFSAVDPKLGPLADNGGPTLTHMPLPGSPAIDAGAATCPAVDQRGAGRPLGRCDAGAVEAGVAPAVPAAPAAAKLTPRVTGLPKKLVASGVSIVLGTAANPPTASTSQTLTTVGGKGRAAAVIARGTTRIPAGTSRRISVRLTAAGRRLRKTVKVRLRIVATAPDGTEATITRTLRLSRRSR
jgi:predicted outer membrane repeat protein